MEKMFIAALVVIVLLAVAGNLKRRSGSSTDLKYRAKTLMSENEKEWFKAIKRAVPHAHVFAQVAMNQLVEPDGKPYTGPYQSALNKITSRSIDFVLLSPDLSVLIAIEIDDRTHNQKRRKEADDKKTKALQDAGVALLRFPATPVASSEAIKERFVEVIAAKMQKPTDGRIEPTMTPTPLKPL
ncbi:DUF2726 domain-containing protein [uncultured Oxalicibacterium sp.]|uniref:DUF2726 domain-containing protein n=1 Tax=uncultured Oxalicibacterium sp. TaxID=1168540 RepID=UPI0025D7AC98|nr:DUF2726 domain-containing protein [uncultured Oxalicibacterium sp.]